jgi:hypothetical protein
MARKKTVKQPVKVVQKQEVKRVLNVETQRVVKRN